MNYADKAVGENIMNIGFFDSGAGGLSVLHAAVGRLPQYNYMYYGDTAHVPYGARSEDEVYELTKTGIEYLFAHNCALVIVACNTSSAETLRRLQDTYLKETYPDRRILGVIIPTIETLVQSGAHHAALIATKRTVASHKYPIELQKYAGDTVQLEEIATPNIVSSIEACEFDRAAQEAIDAIVSAPDTVDTVLLGCTHYCFIKEALRRHFDAQLRILSQDEIIPEKLATYLANHPEIETTLARDGERIVHFTGQQPSCEPFRLSELESKKGSGTV